MTTRSPRSTHLSLAALLILGGLACATPAWGVAGAALDATTPTAITAGVVALGTAARLRRGGHRS